MNSVMRQYKANSLVKKNEIAINFHNYNITYSELDEMSDKLARGIINSGYTKQNIGVIYTKDYELIIVILAIMKSGNVYVPIDPKTPQQRIDYIIENSKINLIIGKPQYKYSVTDSKFSTIGELNLDSECAIKLPEVDDEDTAYIIYTSGTTGNPKGVVISHENIIHMVESAKKIGINSTNDDRWSMYHSYAFDYSIWEIFMPLLTGAVLCVVPDKIIKDVTCQIEYIVAERITFLSLTPSVFKRILYSDNVTTLSDSNLKYIIFGGERFDVSDYMKWRNIVSNREIKLINMYGLTETTVHATYHHLDKSDLDDLSLSPIGQPLDHFQIRLLDTDGKYREVRDGEIGEIYVSGCALAKEYYNNLQNTIDRFIMLDDGKRYYKTGDLAKTINKKLYYIGRCDRQVKFHGYRIEIDSVESTLLKNERIENCIVEIINLENTQVMFCFYQSPKKN